MIIENPILSGSAELSGSFTTDGTISGSFSGDGTNLTNIQSASFATTASYAQNAEGSGFPFTGSAEITGSLTSNEIQATNRLNIPQGTTAERDTNPISGDLRYNTSTNRLEFYNGSIWITFNSNDAILDGDTAQLSVTANDAAAENVAIEVEYLVIAGGGGGGGGSWTSSLPDEGAGGGGAGGYRSSVTGENSGGGASAESLLELERNTNYTVTVGAGGNGLIDINASASNGNNSQFYNIISLGGGGGAYIGTSHPQFDEGSEGYLGASGGSGGGSTNQRTNGGSGTVNQGFAGGGTNSRDKGGGGGGAGGVGSDNVTSGGGGIGVASNITGELLTRANGGDVNTGTVNGTVNSGNGGGSGTFGGPLNGGSGGSGVVILRYPSAYSINTGVGLTSSTTTVGQNKVTTFTAGTDTISFS